MVIKFNHTPDYARLLVRQLWDRDQWACQTLHRNTELTLVALLPTNLTTTANSAADASSRNGTTGCPKKIGILSSFVFLGLGGVFLGVKNNSKKFGNKKI